MKTTKLMKLVAVCSAVLVCAVLGIASDARADITSDPNAIYKIVNANSGKVMDVVFNSTQASYKLHQWEYLGLASQHWRLWTGNGLVYYIQNINSGMFIEPAARNDGAKIWQMNPAWNIQQQWRITVDSNTGATLYRIRNELTLRSIDVAANGTGNGALIHQWQYVQGVQSQLWQFVRVN
ncbi:hypothetical protein MYSTI_04026 [Myxococcus stipitatus DSM 14675]|uniref:Ricin B lectin domain-containing protein n=1 Tax=Myxococcus stipitatus (strain DSM 14675 / JCM 12634 / Mx s8) TaxID=1278073 RepID=L7UCK5_MYXSD|nr:RICIN domain-containing protein [Myxococcus stipitatus]AGC45327.1 hypothetical protein MYSTI_04026 [Myxococcus stipitatus DSM 14675]